PGDSVYIVFTTVGASNGVYQVNSVPSTSQFAVTASDSLPRTGAGLFPKWSSSGFTKTGTNLLVSIPGVHALNAGDDVFIDFAAGAVVSNGVYQILSVPDATPFLVSSTNTISQQHNR